MRRRAAFLLVLAGCAHVGPAPVAHDRIARSDAAARLLLDVLGRFAPESLGELGIAGLDAEVHDLKPRVDERFREQMAPAIAALEARAAAEADPYLAEDLAILLTAARDYVRATELSDRYLLPYEDVGKLIFRGLHALLDDQVPPARRAAARVRLRRYAGLEAGYAPLTQLAMDRTREQLGRAELLAPTRAQLDQTLASSAVYRRGIGDLLRRYGVAGYEPALAELEQQLVAYDAFLRAEVLPRARADFREPPELYAFQLHQLGVELPPAALAVQARAAFAETQREMQALAARVAAERHLAASDYREVLRALKREQVGGDALPALYRERIHDLEAIIRRERLVTLPARAMRFRVASAAETASQPAPHVDAQGLFARSAELSFVLPLTAAPSANGQPQRYDDFTFAAASWTISAHEGRPGHELQFSSMAARGLSLARTLFAFNSVNVEGWGLYAEAIMRPFMPLEGRLVSLQALLWREARAFLDPGLQLGEVTLEEARRVLVQDVGLSEGMTTQELDRYTFNSPGQAVSYFYGYTRLLALRADVERALGARFDAHRFHECVLAQGLLPPPLLRRAVEQALLPR